jgi:hypothetical protein
MSLQKPFTPQPVTEFEAAFPANIGRLLPAKGDIPEDFWRDRGDACRWLAFQRRWFFAGLKGITVTAKDGIDRSAAIRHLATIQGSYEPSHEHKEAAAAYLASLWLEPVELPAREASS